jgi:hypothetical protein
MHERRGARYCGLLVHGAAMDTEDEGYFCYSCEVRIAAALHALTRSRQRVHFGGVMPELQTSQAECISYYCGPACAQKHLPGVMAAERVPIPEQPPGIGPIEACAVCKGPVDMTLFHLAYTLDQELHKPGGVEVLDAGEIAVVCNRCAPGLSVVTTAQTDRNDEVTVPVSATKTQAETV